MQRRPLIRLLVSTVSFFLSRVSPAAVLGVGDMEMYLACTVHRCRASRRPVLVSLCGWVNVRVVRATDGGRGRRQCAVRRPTSSGPSPQPPLVDKLRLAFSLSCSLYPPFSPSGSLGRSHRGHSRPTRNTRRVACRFPPQFSRPAGRPAPGAGRNARAKST